MRFYQYWILLIGSILVIITIKNIIKMFFLFTRKDSYIDKNLDLVRSDYRTFGPLNRGRSKTCCLVYLHERESFLSSAYAEGYGGFRRPLRNTRIGSLFHAVLLIPFIG